jgi:hypothetical protein
MSCLLKKCSADGVVTTFTLGYYFLQKKKKKKRHNLNSACHMEKGRYASANLASSRTSCCSFMAATEPDTPINTRGRRISADDAAIPPQR